MENKQPALSSLKQLISDGRSKGYLTHAEIKEHLSSEMSDSEQIAELLQTLEEMNIVVCETAPEADDLILNQNNTEPENIISDIGKTTDPVRMYMREMGSVGLLDRKSEVDIAKRIEEGINQVQSCVAEYPSAIGCVLKQYERYLNGDIKLSDILIGFVTDEDTDLEIPTDDISESEYEDTNLEVDESIDEGEAINVVDNDDEESEDGSDIGSSEDEQGPDPEFSQKMFESLKVRYEETIECLEKHGRGSKKTKDAINKLAEIFRQFRLVTKQYNELIGNMCEVMDKVKVQDRSIRKILVDNCRMKVEDFKRYYANSKKESSMEWFEKIIKLKKPFVEKVKTYESSIR